MRGWFVVLAGLLVGAAGAASAGPAVESPANWTVWSDDAQETPVPVSADIKSVRVATTPSDLHIEFATHDATTPSPLVSSSVSFVAQQAEGLGIQIAWDTEAHVWVGDREATTDWAMADGATSTNWHLQVAWRVLGIDLGSPFALRELDVATAAEAPLGMAYAGRLDSANGPDLEFTPVGPGMVAISMANLVDGETVEGPDFGGGASIALDAAGAPLIAYYVYDESRGTARGIYLATIRGTAWAPQRVGDVSLTSDNGRDAQMRTQVAADGALQVVLFTDDPAVDDAEDGPGRLGTPDSVYVLASDNGWKREDPTPGGTSDVTAEDVPDLAARSGRVVAAVPVGNDVWVTERTGPGAWDVLGRLADADTAKLALDSKGVVHAAYAVYGGSDGSWRNGDLFYASSSGGFKGIRVGKNIDSGWEEPETDGSFAIAVGPEDQVALLWNDGGEPVRDHEQKVAVLEGGSWSYDHAPLVPGHGNPQYTMRLGYTSLGHLVAASGYGGTDTLAVRGPNGGWVTKELPRYDVWDMAVSPNGRIYFAYTQPHGGTTVAVSGYGVSPQFAAGTAPAAEAASIPLAAAPGLLAILVGVAALLRRRAA